MIQLEEAQKILVEYAGEISDTEEVSLLEATGRVLAEDIAAERDQPPFPRSPLDGYAVRGEDTEGASEECPVTLRVIGKIYAGEVFDGQLKEGEAVCLMTGAPIPKGADAVIRQEDTKRSGDAVEIFRGVEPYQNYCYQGEDYSRGEILLKKGCVLGGGAVGVAASTGIDTVCVKRQARIAVIATGDELLAPGEEYQYGKIYNNNLFYIGARLKELGNPAWKMEKIGDDPMRMAAAVAEAAKHADLIITTGGVSVGEKDIMHEVIKSLGADQLFWRVELKPGAPTLAAIYHGTVLLCLSGNPYGAVANFELLARPVIAKLTGNAAWCMNKKKVVAENDFRKPAGCRRFIRGISEGDFVKVCGGNHASGAITSMRDANCLVEISEDMAGIKEGEEVWVHLL